ncbi:MAG: hypothetical protein VX346_20915 [Planctomycetota bacterium]|nr:hypothetical protein [Planctomycetota bacterium]
MVSTRLRESVARSTGAVVAILVLLIAGCDSLPSAPALRDSAVYTNEDAGLKFLVPTGWTCSANAVLPNQIEREIVLAQWRMRTPVQGASVEILCFDKDQQFDLHRYHSGPSHGSKQWNSQADPAEVKINGNSATRLTYVAEISGTEMRKHVVCFRRGLRVFSFIGLFYDNDEKAEQQLQRALDSIQWQG